MESTNNDKIQKTIVTPGIGGQPTFSTGTKVSRIKIKFLFFFLTGLLSTPRHFFLGLFSFYYTNN